MPTQLERVTDERAFPSRDVELGVELSTRAFRFAESLSRCDDLEQLGQMFQREIRLLGMTASASGMVSGPRQSSEPFFHFVNWPAEWLELYRSRGYMLTDPAPRWAIASGAPISWTELMETLPRDDPGHEIYAEASQLGFTEGLVTPVRAFDGSLGLVSVGGDRGRLRAHERLFLQAISVVALHRGEAISAPAETPQAPPVLSPPVLSPPVLTPPVLTPPVLPSPVCEGFGPARRSGGSGGAPGGQDLEPAPHMLLTERFSLTTAEVKVALALYQGQSLSGLAALSKTSVNTLRVQLASIFLKTGAHRQVELIKVIRVALSAADPF